MISKASLKVALIIPAIDAKGPTIFTKYLIADLLKIVEHLEVFYFKDTEKIDMGAQCTKISFWKARDFGDFDIVHSTMALPDIYAARFVDPNKWVSSMHNYMATDLEMSYPFFKAKCIEFLWCRALKECRNIIVSSQAMREYYREFLGNKSYEIISYGISEPSYSQILSKDYKTIQGFKQKGYTVIGSVGVLVKRKGFDLLLDVLKEKSEYALVIIGDGAEYDNLLKKSKQLHIEDRVFFSGFRDNSYNYYQYFDIYAHVSYSEGFGIAMLEAMSKGLPIVCSRLDIYEEYFSEHEVSYFAPGDTNSLKLAFDAVEQNRNMYCLASRRLYTKCFSSRVMAERHLVFYNALLSKTTLIH